MPVERRREVVSGLGYCFNCLARSHSQNYCTSEEVCRRCDQTHHTLLHLPSRQEQRERLAVVRATARVQRQQQPRQRQPPRSRQQPPQRLQTPRRQRPQQCRNQQRSRRPAPQRVQQRSTRQQRQQRTQTQQQQQPQRRQRQSRLCHRQATSSAVTVQQPTTVTAPDQKKLIAAIKSIAEVLCTE